MLKDYWKLYSTGMAIGILRSKFQHNRTNARIFTAFTVLFDVATVIMLVQGIVNLHHMIKG